MNKPTVTVTTLTAVATEGLTFTAKHGPLGLNGKPGWQIEGPGGVWPGVVGIDQAQATVLLADCVEAHDRWYAETSAADEQLADRKEAIKDYFRKAKSDG